MTETMTTEHNQNSFQAPTVPSFVRPFRMSEQIDKIAAALSKAQGAMKHPKKNKTAKVTMKNGDKYQYDYADLADVLDALREPFAANGLALVQIPYVDRATESTCIGVVTLMTHESGQWIEGELVMPVADAKPQSIGSAITYGRRYMAGPMAGLSSEDDDDASAAQGNDGVTGARQRGESGGQTSRPESGLTDRQTSALGAFQTFGVTKEGVEAIVGVPIERCQEAELAKLRSLYEDVKAGTVTIENLKKMATPPARVAVGGRKPSDPATKAKLESQFPAS